MKPRQTKECKKHGQTLFVEESASGRWRCLKCRVDAVKKRRRKVKEKAIEYKGGKCVLCGYNKCSSALEFNHKDPEEKDFSISSKGNTISWDRVKAELDKCILVCANCHREIHQSLLYEK